MGTKKYFPYTFVTRDNIEKRNQQLIMAVNWCKENSKRGWAALKTGQFPLIKDQHTINPRLDGHVKLDSKRNIIAF